MSKNALAELETGGKAIKRAQYEAFEFSLESPGVVLVRNGSYGDESDDHEYRVTVESGVPVGCECPADTYHPGACKHRIAVAIREPVLEAATADDRSHQVATDGGILVAGDDAEILDESDDDGDSDGRPEDCDCWDPDGDLPCWVCYRDGFRTTNPDATGEVLE